MAKETDYYNEIALKIIKYLQGLSGNEYQFAYAENNYLPSLVKEIESKLGGKTTYNSEYIPNLKLDILMGVKKTNYNHISLILFEVKLLESLSLIEYSQLLGYLMVSTKIPIGILFLVAKTGSKAPLSRELNDLISLNLLPMDIVSKINNDITFPVKSGICYYHPGNGIYWIDTNKIQGISNYEQFINEIIKNVEQRLQPDSPMS